MEVSAWYEGGHGNGIRSRLNLTTAIAVRHQNANKRPEDCNRASSRKKLLLLKRKKRAQTARIVSSCVGVKGSG